MWKCFIYSTLQSNSKFLSRVWILLCKIVVQWITWMLSWRVCQMQGIVMVIKQCLNCLAQCPILPWALLKKGLYISKETAKYNFNYVKCDLLINAWCFLVSFRILWKALGHWRKISHSRSFCLPERVKSAKSQEETDLSRDRAANHPLLWASESLDVDMQDFKQAFQTVSNHHFNIIIIWLGAHHNVLIFHLEH